MKKVLIVVGLILVSASLVSGQASYDEVCQGDFLHDLDVDADDVTIFLEHFGREPYYLPCPPFGPGIVRVTGQTGSVYPGDDGDVHAGVSIVDPDIIVRFQNNGDGTVTDRLTGLVWLENAGCGNFPTTWQNAMDYIATLGHGNDCNTGGIWTLTDGSSPGDWRLPNINELHSLLNFAYKDPALGNSNSDGKLQYTNGDPFIGVANAIYWTSTSDAGALGTNAWAIDIGTGVASTIGLGNLGYPMPVKAGIVMPDY